MEIVPEPAGKGLELYRLGVIVAAGPDKSSQLFFRCIAQGLGLTPSSRSYTGYQAIFMSSFPPDARLFNEYHALLVALGKDACRACPLCARCCLSDLCRYALQRPASSAKLSLVQDYGPQR